jgi:hypothetical protein
MINVSHKRRRAVIALLVCVIRTVCRKQFIFPLFIIITSFFIFFVSNSDAYKRYNDGCQTCHGRFTDGQHGNSTLEMHRNPYVMSTDCKLCHKSGNKKNPYIGTSEGTSDIPGQGCVGCHGREEDAGHDGGGTANSPGLGAGLRQHHWNIGATLCADCHSDADPANYTPVGEHVKPAYYGSVDTNSNNPCNQIAQHDLNENWDNVNLIGLDNDGDGLYDIDDPDCDGVEMDCFDGIDDDNDGFTDCADTDCDRAQGMPTTCGTGECTSGGIEKCENGMLVDTCKPRSPTAEVCDGLDNNCDGSIDENLARATICGVGECAGNTGTETCTAGVWGNNACDPLAGATAETCDNLDNDCDGAVDENLTQPTTCGVGECGSTGVETCTDGTWGGDTCTPGVPSDELCDGFDNDCDGNSDEDFTDLGTTCTVGVGACEAAGSYVCTADGLSTECNATPGTPSPEVCDGIDNDCDDTVDDITPEPTTCGIGECTSTGQTTCVGGVPGDTCTPGPSIAELCDGLDNDCDNSVDEDFTDLGMTCTAGIGACESTGNYICTADGLGTECNATPGTPSIEGPEGNPTCGRIVRVLQQVYWTIIVMA